MFIRKKMFVYCLSMLFGFLTLSVVGMGMPRIDTHKTFKQDEKSLKRQEGKTLLDAAREGHLNLIHFSLGRGVEVTYKLSDDLDIDALYWASYKGHADCIRALVSAGADPNTTYLDSGDLTPLHLAALHKHVACINVLLEMGAHHSPHAKRDGHTPLHDAAGSDCCESVEALLVAGAHVETHDRYGCVPIERAVVSTCLKSTRVLLKAGASPFAKAFGSMAPTNGTVMDVVREQLKIEEFWYSVACEQQETSKQEIASEKIKKIEDIIALLQEYKARWSMREFCAVSFLRLGAESPAHALPKDVYKPIFNQLLRLKEK